MAIENPCQRRECCRCALHSVRQYQKDVLDRFWIGSSADGPEARGLLAGPGGTCRVRRRLSGRDCELRRVARFRAPQRRCLAHHDSSALRKVRESRRPQVHGDRGHARGLGVDESVPLRWKLVTQAEQPPERPGIGVCQQAQNERRSRDVLPKINSNGRSQCALVCGRLAEFVLAQLSGAHDARRATS